MRRWSAARSEQSVEEQEHVFVNPMNCQEISMLYAMQVNMHACVCVPTCVHAIHINNGCEMHEI